MHTLSLKQGDTGKSAVQHTRRIKISSCSSPLASQIYLQTIELYLSHVMTLCMLKQGKLFGPYSRLYYPQECHERVTIDIF